MSYFRYPKNRRYMKYRAVCVRDVSDNTVWYKLLDLETGVWSAWTFANGALAAIYSAYMDEHGIFYIVGQEWYYRVDLYTGTGLGWVAM